MPICCSEIDLFIVVSAVGRVDLVASVNSLLTDQALRTPLPARLLPLSPNGAAAARAVLDTHSPALHLGSHLPLHPELHPALHHPALHPVPHHPTLHHSTVHHELPVHHEVHHEVHHDVHHDGHHHASFHYDPLLLEHDLHHPLPHVPVVHYEHHDADPLHHHHHNIPPPYHHPILTDILPHIPVHLHVIY